MSRDDHRIDGVAIDLVIDELGAYRTIRITSHESASTQSQEARRGDRRDIGDLLEQDLGELEVGVGTEMGTHRLPALSPAGGRYARPARTAGDFVESPARE